MAGGSESPRQKMISLMYLVFISMLALSMGKKVLSSFGYLNEKVVDANTNNIQTIDLTLSDLATKASEQPDKYKKINDKAVQIHKLARDYYAYLGTVKDSLLIGVEDPGDYESMDKEDAGDELFFAGEKLSKSGQAFVDNINNFRDGVIQVLGAGANAKILAKLEKRFNTDDVVKGPSKQTWFNSRFEGFPLVATLTNISVIQADVLTSENEIYSSLLGKQLSADASINSNTYQAIVIPSRPAVFPGDTFEGKIVLGRYDASLKPDKVVINGSEVKGRENGAAVMKFKAGKVGENSIKGNFVFKQGGKIVEIPINSSYLVVPKPNAAVVSADKMNVVYRGVENPITISIPGVSDNNVKASAEGLKQVKGTKYLLSPGKGKEVVINITGKTSDGTVIKSPPVTFRIKDIPPPVATIRKQYGTIKLPKSSLAKSFVAASLVDFDFDLKLRVSGFKVKVPGQSTVVVKGAKFDAKAQKALLKAKRGDVISIFDVKANIIGNSSYKLKGVMPLSVELVN